MERIWDDILTKPLQVIVFMEFSAELINFTFDYEDDSITCEDLVNTTLLSKKSTCVKPGDTNTRYRL